MEESDAGEYGKIMLLQKILKPLCVACLLTPSVVYAWTQGGTGGDFDFGGNIDPSAPEKLWLVMTGPAIGGLELSLQEGGKLARLELQQTIPVLGIRPDRAVDDVFKGRADGGLAPRITYTGVVNGGTRDKGRLPMELDVHIKGAPSKVIGWLRFNLYTGAAVSQAGGVNANRLYSVYASQPGEAFYGGVGRNPEEVVDDAVLQLGERFPVFSAYFNAQGMTGTGKQAVEFSNPALSYSAFYAAGLLQGDEIFIRMDESYHPTQNEQWTARLGITVDYL